MPFLSPDGSEQVTVDLRQVGPRTFQLLEGFRYVDPVTGASYGVPAHDLSAPPVGANGTDLASVPPLLWGLFASYGHHTRAALLHDELVHDARRIPDDGEAEAFRSVADRVFRTALLESGVPPVRAWLMWAAVSFGRYWWHRRTLGVLMAAQLGAALALLVLAPVLWDGWWHLLAAFVAPGAAAAPWGRDAPVVALGSYVAPVVAPVVVVTYVATLLLWLPAAAEWALGASPRPEFPRPLQRRRQRRGF